jgi:hypothetical protein
MTIDTFTVSALIASAFAALVLIRFVASSYAPARSA